MPGYARCLCKAAGAQQEGQPAQKHRPEGVELSACHMCQVIPHIRALPDLSKRVSLLGNAKHPGVFNLLALKHTMAAPHTFTEQPDLG